VLADQLAEQQVAVGRARRAASQTEHLGDRLNETHLAQSKVASALAEARSEVAAADALLAQTRTTIGSLSTERATLLIDSRGAADIEGLIAEHQVRARIFEDARTALRVHQIAARAAEEAAAMASAAAVDAGFADVTAAQVALLSDDSLSGATSAIVAADEAARAASATLADPAVSRRLAVDAPDPALLDAAHAVAARERDDAGSAYDQERKRVSRLAVLRDTLTRELLAWAPVREQYAVAAGLSAFVEGKGPDNPQRMRLSAYVLSERLRQVVDAANERLARMSDQRYSLEHTDDRGAGELRGGLSLLIRDDWNGTRRDPATLSGGETFVVSLALALGLADTVSHEAGGTDIDTLFIDEGFGSLDAETLEDVMDTLDSLRDGGRVVGIVSHVAELRTRITAQLEVSKSRSGSTIRAAVSVG
jgi:exonuclease SbcC